MTDYTSTTPQSKGFMGTNTNWSNDLLSSIEKFTDKPEPAPMAEQSKTNIRTTSKIEKTEDIFQKDDSLKHLKTFALGEKANKTDRDALAGSPLGFDVRDWKGTSREKGDMGFKVAMAVLGPQYCSEPSAWWASTGRKAPSCKSTNEAYGMIWDEFSENTNKAYESMTAAQQAREQFGKDLNDFVTKTTSGELADRPSLEQFEALKSGGVEWKSLILAGNAMRILKGSDKRFDSYYDMDLMGRLRDSLEGDEKAKGIFMNTLFNEHKNHYRETLKNPMNIDSDFVRGMADELSPLVLGTDRMMMGMNKFAKRAWRGAFTMGGTEKSFSFGEDANKSYTLNYDSKHVDKELERFNAEYISVLEAAESDVATKDRSVFEKVFATTGGILGDSLPMMIPYIGQAGLVSSSIQRSQEEGLAAGLDYEEAQLRGDLFGATDAAVEFLAFGKFGKMAASMPYINKLVRGGKALDGLAPWRSRLLKSEMAQLGISAASGTLEEGVLEPTAGYLMKSLGNLALDDERGKYKWNDYVGEISQMKDPVFMTSLLLFSGGMSATAFPQIRQEARAFAYSLDHYKAMGGTEAGFLKARKIEDADKQFDFIRDDIQAAWKENPEAAMERSRESMGGMTSAEETRALRQMEGFAALQQMGQLPKFEKSEEEGKYRVYDQALKSNNVTGESESEKRVEGETGKPAFTLMSEEALDQYLRIYMNEETKGMVLTVQNLMAGDITIDALKKDGFLIEEMAGTETFETLKALTDHAMAAVHALEMSGMSREEALRQIDPSVSENLPLRDVLSIAPNAEERLETAKRRGEADTFGSNAYVVRSFDKRGGMKKILRYARGLAGVDDLWEESMEQALLSYCRENSMDVQGLGKQLQEAQLIINEEYGGKEEDRFIDMNIENPTPHDCIEAFSRLGKSKFIVEARENSRLPEWLRKMIDCIVQFMGQFRSLVSLGENLKKMEQEGKLSLPVRQMLGRMAGAVEDIYSEQANLDVSRWVDNYLERARVQGEMDVRLGAGVANEAESVEESLEGLNEEQKDREEQEKELDDREIERLRKEHEESGRKLTDEEIAQAREQATRDREGAALGVIGEADVLGVFAGGRCVTVSDGVYQGFVDLDRLTLCKDVPQFKQGADPETGIKNRIVGAWRRDSAPVSVWMRQDGRLEVISGRHRFAACADKDICCQVYVENAEHDLAWAKQHDVENNIRDGQAGMFEIARYVRDGNLSMDEATERGIARAGASMKGVEVGLYADRSLMAALENGEVNEDDAYRVAKSFPNNEVQRLGVNVLRDGGGWTEAYNSMQAKVVMDMIARDNEEAGVQMGIDLFGNTDTDELFRLMGQYAARRYSELGKEMTAINGASKNPRLAKKYGIDVNDPESARKAVAALQEQRNQWKNFALHSDLLNEANEFAKEELGIEPPKASVNFSNTGNHSLEMKRRAEVWERLKNQPSLSLDFKEAYLQNQKEANAAVREEYRKLQGSLNNPRVGAITSDGISVYFGSRGFREATAKVGSNRDKLVALAHIERVLENAEFLEETPNEKSDRKQYVEAYRYYARKVEIQGSIYFAHVTLEKQGDYWFYEVGLNLENEKGVESMMTDAPADEAGSGHVSSAPKTRFIKWVASVNTFLSSNDLTNNETATFSIIGEKAETFREYNNNGLTYFDPADGRRKAILDSRGVRLKREVFSVPAGGLTRATLAAVLDYEELFRAYPDLKKYTVHFFNDGKVPVCGYFDAENKHIAVNVAVGKEETLDTLLHEIQHAIQRHEGFSRGAGDMNKERALSYVNESIAQLEERNDEWAKEAAPRLRKLAEGLAEGTVDPMSVYYSSHGEKEAMLSGSFAQGSIGPSMAGMNGTRMTDTETSIPLTGNITELGGITFDKGRFGRMATNILIPPGDWVADQLLFRIRASLERAAKRFAGYSSKDDGLALFAEASELIASAEKFLPGNYGFALEPYKIWLNVFSRLAGSGDIKNAIKGIPMTKWPEIMQGSFIKQLALAVEKGYVRDTEIWEELGLGDIPADLNQTYGEGYNELLDEGRERFADEPNAESKAKDYAMNGILEEMQKDGMFEEFMRALGEVKVHRLAARFLNRIVEQIDKFRKDKMLGKIRRVTSNVTPTKKPGEKPARGKMGAEAYGQMGKYIQLLEMTESQYERFFEEKYPENAEEGKRYEDIPSDGLLEIVMTDEDGNKIAVTCEKQEFDVYACYAKMNVEQAEKCAASLGEFISTSRNAWDNAKEKHRAKIEGQARAVLDKTGIVKGDVKGERVNREQLQTLPKGKTSLFDAFMNFGQYMDTLSKYPELREWALDMKARAARASINIEVSEKNRLAAVDNAIEEIAGVKGKYEKADWLYEFKRSRGTEITLTEEEPDWKEKAKVEYRERLLKLLSRKARVHGLEALKPYLRHFNVSEILRSEIEMKYNRPGKELSAKETKKAEEHMDRVFTENEWATYKDMNSFVTDRAAKLRKTSDWGKEKNPKEARTTIVRSLSRDVAANIILLYEQADYTDMLRRKGYNADVIGQLREFVGEEGMAFAYRLRGLLGQRSKMIQSLVEKRYGAPFPLVDNYFRAHFDVDTELQNKTIAEGTSYGDAATGGKFGMTYSRRKHNAELDMNMGASAVFMSASKEQDVFLHCSELSRDMRSFLNFRDNGLSVDRSLGEILGSDAVGKLKKWVDVFDRTGVEHIRGHIDMNKFLDRLSGAAAHVLLSWRIPTLVKQGTALMNGLYGSDEVNVREGFKAMGRIISGTAVKSAADMLAMDEIGSRDKTAYSVTRDALAAPRNKAISRWDVFSRRGMDNIESLDVCCNAISSAVVYDVVYRRLKKENPEAGDNAWDAGAMQAVREALETKSQPMNHRMRSLVAQNKFWMLAAPFFLTGESINTTARVISLARKGKWGKAAILYFWNGAMLTVFQALINFLTDDDERRKKRSITGYILGIIAGPLSGIPLISDAFGYAIEKGAHLIPWEPVKDVYVSKSNGLIAYNGVEESYRSAVKAWDAIKDSDASWEDKSIAFNGLLRSAAAMVVPFIVPDSKMKAAVAGGALSVAAGTNLLDFGLKTERSIRNNGTDTNKWLALSAKEEAEKKREKSERAKEKRERKSK